MTATQTQTDPLPENQQTAPMTGLDVEILEERIAPGLDLNNRCETVLDVEELEERIAPGLHIANRCETLCG